MGVLLYSVLSIPSKPWYHSKEKNENLVIIGNLVQALGGAATRLAGVPPVEQQSNTQESTPPAAKRPSVEAHVEPSYKQREAKLDEWERRLAAEWTELYREQQELESRTTALDAIATELSQLRQQLAARENELIFREAKIENDATGVQMAQQHLKKAQTAFRQEAAAFFTQYPQAQQPGSKLDSAVSGSPLPSSPEELPHREAESNTSRPLILSDTARLEALAHPEFGGERYDGQRVQIHVAHASNNQDLVAKFMTHMSGAVRRQWAEVTASNERSGLTRGGLPTHEITETNEADRVRTADIVMVLVDADAFNSEHLNQMVQLAAEKWQAHKQAGSKNTLLVPVLFGDVKDTLPRLEDLTSLPANEQPIAKATSKDTAISETMGEIRRAAATVAKNRGLASYQILNRPR